MVTKTREQKTSDKSEEVRKRTLGLMNNTLDISHNIHERNLSLYQKASELYELYIKREDDIPNKKTFSTVKKNMEVLIRSINGNDLSDAVKDKAAYAANEQLIKLQENTRDGDPTKLLVEELEQGVKAANYEIGVATKMEISFDKLIKNCKDGSKDGLASVHDTMGSAEEVEKVITLITWLKADDIILKKIAFAAHDAVYGKIEDVHKALDVDAISPEQLRHSFLESPEKNGKQRTTTEALQILCEDPEGLNYVTTPNSTVESVRSHTENLPANDGGTEASRQSETELFVTQHWHKHVHEYYANLRNSIDVDKDSHAKIMLILNEYPAKEAGKKPMPKEIGLELWHEISNVWLKETHTIDPINRQRLFEKAHEAYETGNENAALETSREALALHANFYKAELIANFLAKYLQSSDPETKITRLDILNHDVKPTLEEQERLERELEHEKDPVIREKIMEMLDRTDSVMLELLQDKDWKTFDQMKVKDIIKNKFRFSELHDSNTSLLLKYLNQMNEKVQHSNYSDDPGLWKYIYEMLYDAYKKNKLPTPLESVKREEMSGPPLIYDSRASPLQESRAANKAAAPEFVTPAGRQTFEKEEERKPVEEEKAPAPTIGQQEKTESAEKSTDTGIDTLPPLVSPEFVGSGENQQAV